jgi:hypothetical protein
MVIGGMIVGVVILWIIAAVLAYLLVRGGTRE